ncbi:MAG: hypothetical protein AAFR00_01150 [Pseudomonadota bacterium]
MLSREFLLHAFRIVPFTRWPVLIWHLLMASDWIAHLTETGQPVPKLVVTQTGEIYRLEWGGPGAGHWRARLHARAAEPGDSTVQRHLAAHHGRQAAAFAGAMAANKSAPATTGRIAPRDPRQPDIEWAHRHNIARPTPPDGSCAQPPPLP